MPPLGQQSGGQPKAAMTLQPECKVQPRKSSSLVRFSQTLIQLCKFSLRIFDLIRQKLTGKSTFFVLLSHCQVLVLVSKLIIRVTGANKALHFHI